jgi:hypothetical protein
MSPPASKAASGSEEDGDDVPETEREEKLGRAAGTRAKVGQILKGFLYVLKLIISVFRPRFDSRRRVRPKSKASLLRRMDDFVDCDFSIYLSLMWLLCTLLYRLAPFAVPVLLVAS